MLVEIEGIFKGVREQEGVLVLSLESDGREYDAHASSPLIGRDLEPVVGAVVRVRGLALPVFNTRGEIVRPRVDVVSRDGFTVVTPPTASPFACQRVPLGSLGHYRPQPFEGRIVRIEGTVVHADPTGVIYVQDAASGVAVRPQASEPVRAGDRIEAAGFIDSSGRVAGLEQAFVKRLTPGSPPEPLVVTPDEIVAVNEAAWASGRMAAPGDYDGCLVKFSGELVESRPTTDGGLLMVHAGDSSVTAVAGNDDFAWLRRPPPGVALELVGIVRTEWSQVPGEQFSRPLRRLGLVVRSAEDVRLVRPPPWWTARRITAVLAGGVVAATVGGFATGSWILLLSRQVRSQLAVIERNPREEAVVDERRRIAREFHDSLRNLREPGRGGRQRDPTCLRVGRAGHVRRPRRPPEGGGDRRRDRLRSCRQRNPRRAFWDPRHAGTGAAARGQTLDRHRPGRSPIVW